MSEFCAVHTSEFSLPRREHKNVCE